MALEYLKAGKKLPVFRFKDIAHEDEFSHFCQV